MPPSNVCPDKKEILAQTWQMLTEAVRNPSAPARNFAFATCNASSQPEVRTVVLRGVNEATGTVSFFTDKASTKVSTLEHNPKSELMCWDPNRAVQLRLSSKSVILHHKDAVSAQKWKDEVPERCRVSYGKAPDTGAFITAPFDYQLTPSEEYFVVVDCVVDVIEHLSLRAEHFRIQFHRENGWEGQWVSP